MVPNPFNEGGEEDSILLLPALRPDFGAFHAAMADSAGNVWVGRRRECATIAHASARCLVTVERVVERLSVGNVYVNRNMIGAVVGTQPFGGHGLSGTGPKAGGPHYLLRFATEQMVTINTAAAGGNANLIAMGE